MNHIVVRTGDGILLGKLEGLQAWTFARQSNAVGWFMVECADVDARWLGVDRILEFYRSPPGVAPVLIGVGLLRSWEWRRTDSGAIALRLQGPDQMDLIARRVVAYTDPEANWNKSGPADDLMKAVVRENMGTLSTDPWYNRGRAYDPDLFSVAPDEGKGRTVKKEFQFRNTLSVIKELADATTWPSADNNWVGVAVYYDVEYIGPARFLFKTYSPLRGIDRTLGTQVAPLIFSEEAGNLVEPALKFDYSEERNIIYGLGPGTGESRMVDPENDQVRERLSPWNLHEDVVSATEETTLQGIAWHSYQKMQDLRPQVVFNGMLRDTANCRFGVDWNYGDLVTVRFLGMEFDGRIDSFSVGVNANGLEEVRASVSITKALEGHPT
jgi:hypothetical protein